MAVFEITAPDGRKFKVEGETREGALRALQQHLGQPKPPVEQKPQSGVGALSREFVQGMTASFGDEAISGARALLGAEPNAQGGLDWFQYDRGLGERYSENLEYTRGKMDEYSEENPRKAGAARIGGAVTGAVLAAPKVAKAAQATGIMRPLAAGSSLSRRAGRMAVAGAGAGALEGFGAGEGGLGNRLQSSALGAGVGAVFAPMVGLPLGAIGNAAGRLYGKGVRAVFSNRRMYNRNTGELTESGVKRLAALGFDNLDQMSKEMQSAMGIAAEKTVDAADDLATGAAVGRIAAGERFGVPLTRGQSTGDVIQSATEENMRAGSRGQPAADVMRGFDAQQSSAVEAARQGIVPPQSEGIPNAIDAADTVIAGVRREAEAARTAGRDAYSALEESGAALRGSDYAGLGQRIEAAVSGQRVRVDGGTPNAQSAMATLQDTFEGAERGSVPFTDIERARQRLLVYKRAADRSGTGADQIAMRAVVDEFDAYLDDTITDALIQGDAAVLGQAKDARALWARYRATFLGREGADNVIRKIVQDDLTPDQVAGWLYGATTNIGGGQTAKVASRIKDILGETSPEWQEVRVAAWNRATQATPGRDDFGPQRMASSISELLDGKGQTLGRELFTAAERRTMAEFRDMLKTLVPPRRATNPSGTSYDVQRAMQGMAQNLSVMIAGTTGGPGAAVGTAVAAQGAQGAQGFRAALQARAAAKGITFKPVSTPTAVGAGVGVGSSAQDRTIR